jgi:2-polyprenyl-3-methyl-5-hydroxy-6-metoxy-1,4-benzoquinol methylase
MQKEMSEINKRAWSYRAYERWETKSGSPLETAKEMKRDPLQYVRRHIDYLGDVAGKKVAVLLGSSGRKAIPLAMLGAQVTVVDISPENARYALQTAKEAGVEINFIISDLFAINMVELRNTFDIVYLEGGILHYFADLEPFANIVFELLSHEGRLVLNDFHPIRKIIKARGDDAFVVEGDYFDTELFYGEVAYKSMFPDNEQDDFPDCLLRYWNLGEIISAIAACGLVIEKLVEEPRYDKHKNLPGNFTIIANKFKVDRGWD